MSNNVPAPVNQADPILAEHAAEIRRLGKRAVGDVIEIGRRLAECRAILKDDGRWRAWLDSELKLSPQTAGRFVQVYELSEGCSNLEHLDLPVSALYLLAAPSTPETTRTEILKRTQSGEIIPFSEIKRTIDEVKRTIDAAKGRKQPSRRKPTTTTPTKPKPSDFDVPLKPSHERAARKLRNHFGQVPTEVQRHFLEEMHQADDIGKEAHIEELENLTRQQATEIKGLIKEGRSLILQLAGAKCQIEELKTKHRFRDVTGKDFVAVITELDMPVVWTAEEIIAEINHPNLTPEHLRRAAELLHHIADALAVRKPPPVGDGFDIPAWHENKSRFDNAVKPARAQIDVGDEP